MMSSTFHGVVEETASRTTSKCKWRIQQKLYFFGSLGHKWGAIESAGGSADKKDGRFALAVRGGTEPPHRKNVPPLAEILPRDQLRYNHTTPGRLPTAAVGGTLTISGFVRGEVANQGKIVQHVQGGQEGGRRIIPYLLQLASMNTLLCGGAEEQQARLPVPCTRRGIVHSRCVI